MPTRSSTQGSFANHSDVQRPMKVAISRPSGLSVRCSSSSQRVEVVREMREDRDRVDQIEAPMLQFQRRDRDRLPRVERRTEVVLHPLDARPVDVAAPEFRGLGLARRSGAGSVLPPSRSRVSACPRRTSRRGAGPRSGASSARRAPDRRRRDRCPHSPRKRARRAPVAGGADPVTWLACAASLVSQTRPARPQSGVIQGSLATAPSPPSDREPSSRSCSVAAPA